VPSGPTLGELCDALRDELGEYQARVTIQV